MLEILTKWNYTDGFHQRHQRHHTHEQQNHCALIDNALVTLTVNNGWEGIIIYGYIRDTAIITKLPIGIRTLNTLPTKP